MTEIARSRFSGELHWPGMVFGHRLPTRAVIDVGELPASHDRI